MIKPLLGAGLLVAATLGFASSASAQAAGASGTLIVLNKRAATANIIDLASQRTLATLPTGQGPHELVVSSDGRVAVAANYGGQSAGSSLTIIDVPALVVARTIDLGRYTRPHGLAFLPGDSVLAVTSESTQSVALVHVADGTIVGTIATDQGGSHMLAMVGDGSRIYTSNIQGNSVTELDVAARRPLRVLDVPPQPEAITVTPAGDEVWVGSNALGTVSVLDAATGTIKGTIEGFAWPYRILITPDRRLAIVPDLRQHAVRFVDAVTLEEVERLDLPAAGPQGVALSADGGTLYLSLSQEDRVAAIDLATFEIVRYYGTGAGPDGVGVSPIVVSR